MSRYTSMSAHKSLSELSQKDVNILTLFDQDHCRADKYSTCVGSELFIDYSKNLIDDEILANLFNLARESDLETKRNRMFCGEKINATENRSVLHTALRSKGEELTGASAETIRSKISAVRAQMKRFCDGVHNGNILGYSGKKLRNIVNIGIGGSDLGPYMVCEALKHYKVEGISSYFVSNVDSTHLIETLKELVPEETLFIIASKTFTTQETMTNAESAKKWFIENVKDESAISKHFVALSTNKDAVTAFGIDEKNIFEFWDFVGGRYSLWSAIGLSIALNVGYESFEKLLSGARLMDEHFLNSPLETNAPVILALIGIWYRTYLNSESYAVLPYDQYLHRFCAYLQQADMESNGKSVDLDGLEIDYKTGPIVWGEPGTNGQHAFYQLIHQGQQLIPSDFIGFLESLNPKGDHFEKLSANFLAQPAALLTGKSEKQVREELEEKGLMGLETDALVPHKIFKGNKPSNTILLKRLTPKSLGMLIALYEHKIFCQGAIWNINSFDQWGVELGKELAKPILSGLVNEKQPDLDPSTKNLFSKFKSGEI